MGGGCRTGLAPLGILLTDYEGKEQLFGAAAYLAPAPPPPPPHVHSFYFFSQREGKRVRVTVVWPDTRALSVEKCWYFHFCLLGWAQGGHSAPPTPQSLSPPRPPCNLGNVAGFAGHVEFAGMAGHAADFAVCGTRG